MKYILVTGGVMSGVGKGIIASSIGTLLKSCGVHVTSIKIDPYLNIDAGTFSPYEHGTIDRLKMEIYKYRTFGILADVLTFQGKYTYSTTEAKWI